MKRRMRFNKQESTQHLHTSSFGGAAADAGSDLQTREASRSLSSSATVAFLIRLPCACFATNCRAFSTSGSSGILLKTYYESRTGDVRGAHTERGQTQ